MGFQEHKLSAGASEEPVRVNLVNLEKNPEPPDKHLTVGAHWAIYPAWVGWGEENSDRLDWIYYPIISDSHPYNRAWDNLLERYGDSEIPESELPKLESLAMLVKTKQFKCESAIPTEWKPEESVTGLVINDIDTIGSEEKRLINQSFPGLSLDDVLILEKDRTPTGGMGSLGMIGGGLALILIGIGNPIMRSRES
jgi:hypothetical protein